MIITERTRILIALLFIAAICFSVSPAFSKKNEWSENQNKIKDRNRPNIIVYITDDISYNDLGAYGNTVVQTPHIDALAEISMVFDNAYLTSASSSPSRASILTGRYPTSTGAPELSLGLDPLDIDKDIQPFFPGKLKEAGYFNIFAGKLHGHELRDETWDITSGGEGPGLQENWAELLQQRDRDQPFFAWFASFDAHRHGNITNSQRVRNENLPPEEIRTFVINDKAPIYDPDDIIVPPIYYDGPGTRQDLADYYHSVSRTDYYMGELIDELKAQGEFENTIIIHLTDNGRPFPRSKVFTYDSGMKTYLIVYGPDIEAGRTNSLVSAVDIAPTILELAGLKHNDKRIQGVSFTEILRDPEAKIRDFVFAEHNWHVHPAHMRMVRYKDWMYIRNHMPHLQALNSESGARFAAGKELWEAYGDGKTTPAQENIFRVPRPAEELYYTRLDPYQINNLLTQGYTVEEVDEIRKYLSKVLDQWMEEIGDHVPENPTWSFRDASILDRTPRGFWRRGEVPGTKYGADKMTNPGPIKKSDVK